MSRSMRSVRFSRRSRPSSSRSSVVSAPEAPRPASTSAWRTQLRSAVSVRSSSRATVPTALPLSRTTRTACALNSFVNARRFRFAMTPLLPHFRAIWGVYETGAGSGFHSSLHVDSRPSSLPRTESRGAGRGDRVDDVVGGHDRARVVRDIDVERGVHLFIRVARGRVSHHRDLIPELGGKANGRLDAGVRDEADDDELVN